MVSVNIWHTGRVHLQGPGSNDLARRLSELAPSSRTSGRPVSPQSEARATTFHQSHRVFASYGSSGFFIFSLSVRPLFVRAGLRFLWGVCFSRWFPSGRFFHGHIRRKKIRGAGSQAASRRGALPRKAALVSKARAHSYCRSAIIATIRGFVGVRIPLASWLLDRSRARHVAHPLVLIILFHVVYGLSGHSVLPAVAVFVLECWIVSGRSPPINQEGATSQTAPHEGFPPKFLFDARLLNGTSGTIITARYTACTMVLVIVLALAALILSLARSAAFISCVLVMFRRFSCVRFRFRVVPPCRLSCPSCDFTQFHRSRSAGGSLSAVVLLMILLGASLPILRQISLDGVRVGEASHPGPAHPSSQRAPNASNVSETLIQVPGSDSSLPAAHSGALALGSPVAQAFHPYAAPPPTLPVSPTRPSHFCTPPLPRDSPRRVSSSPAPRRRRSRSPVRPSSVRP